MEKGKGRGTHDVQYYRYLNITVVPELVRDGCASANTKH